MIDKIDVCVVTREGILPKGLEFVPTNNIIIETSSPIGIARKRAIDKVTTDWFAFIDDDVEITPEWFGICSLFIKKDVGAIVGTDYYRGLGIFDKVIYNGSLIPKEISYKGRMNGNNVLIKTEIMKDWTPDENLKCYEDLVIGRHILDKGYKIILTPALCYHRKSWNTVKRSALWAGREYSKVYGPKSVLRFSVRKIVEPFRYLVNRGLLFSIFAAYSNFWLIVGIVSSSFKQGK
jgi:glycosyltransferase involved in cell wall biosynthesis